MSFLNENRLLNLATRVAILLLLVWAGLSSARAGLSKMFSEYSSATDSAEASKRALEFNSRDWEAHYTHAIRLADAGQTAESVTQLERATQLRSQDYFLWQELGRLREENNDVSGAIEALTTAVELAPYYAQPHWQLGNVLLRAGQSSKAFQEMRLAATSDQELFGPFLDLAFGYFKDEPTAIVSAVHPRNDIERAAVAKAFLINEQKDSALVLIRSLGSIPDQNRADLVNALLVAGEFQVAHDLWRNGKSDYGLLFDGGFEETISTNEQSFGWRITRLTQTVKVLLDVAQPKQGKRTLRVDYSGNIDESTPVISQLVPVRTTTQYRLSFAVRSEGLVSAGLPIVTIRESPGDKVIAESQTISNGLAGWKTYSLDFRTSESTKAVTLNLQRTPCNVKPCPIVGRVWFDDFDLTAVP